MFLVKRCKVVVKYEVHFRNQFFSLSSELGPAKKMNNVVSTEIGKAKTKGLKKNNMITINY
ncbi:MAG: hypothetical protein CFE24_12260 [Flavobacterium sp. BFFFF2]|nr:MAG: hypothetical protein CFE24_12260 [Flavobacterium sp. BFFFF2]